MDFKKLIETRKSVRTFDGRPLSREDLRKLCEAIERITNPWNIPVRFVLLDAKEHGLSSPVIAGEQLYIAAKVPCVPHCEEAYGYSFEQMVLCAWSLGIGTTWIGGTMKRELFYEGDFSHPIAEPDELLEAVRWAPSAANLQPCRVVRDRSKYHFYEEHPQGYQAKVRWDVQRIDVGIAICHLMCVTGGRCSIEDPGLAADAGLEYIATVTV